MPNEFADWLPELFAGFGPVRLRRMFGGYGVYHDGLMFGLVADDVLYLKCDAGSLPQFEALALPAFTWTDRNGRTATMSYRRAPDAMLDDPDEAARWARIAWEAARRAAARKPAARRRREGTAR